MKKIGRITSAFGIALPAMLFAIPLFAQPAGQWDFDSGDLSASVGQALQYSDGPGGATHTGTGFGTPSSFGIPALSGGIAQIMRFPAGTNGLGYLMPTPLFPNGNGDNVNDYTVILDVLFPAESDGKIRPLVQTDDGFLDSLPTYLIVAKF